MRSMSLCEPASPSKLPAKCEMGQNMSDVREDDPMDIDEPSEESPDRDGWRPRSPSTPSASPAEFSGESEVVEETAPPPSSYPILFYNRYEPYFEFTNLSPHTVHFKGEVYPTAEHLFQAHKFWPAYPDLVERIRRLATPREALREATRLIRFRRTDWFDINIGVMRDVLEAKFTQHPRLTQLLLGTGDRQLIENSPVDSFWGIGEDGKGRNEMGKSLMRLRDRLS